MKFRPENRRPYWLKKLTDNLICNDLVERVICKFDCLSVRYKTGIHRTYVHKLIKKRKHSVQISFKDSIIRNFPFEYQYEHQWDPLDEDEKKELSNYFFISRDLINDYSIIEKELLMQDLYTKLYNNPIKPYYDNRQIYKELQIIKDSNHKYYDNLYCSVSFRKGWPIICKSYDVLKMPNKEKKVLNNIFTNNRLLFLILYKLIFETNKDISITSIFEVLCNRGYGPKWNSPVFYRTLMAKEFYIDQGMTIADRTPALGEKAIVSAALGLKYMPLTKINDKLLNTIGSDVVPISKNADLLWWDNNLEPYLDDSEILDAFKIFNASNFKKMAIYVPWWDYDFFINISKPQKIIKIVQKRKKLKRNYIFMYDKKYCI